MKKDILDQINYGREHKDISFHRMMAKSMGKRCIDSMSLRKVRLYQVLCWIWICVVFKFHV